MMSCAAGHEFRAMKKDYFKLDLDRINAFGEPSFDNTVAYTSLFCPRCGETKEVVSIDRRKGALGAVAP